MPLIIGIDPGLHGGISGLDDTARTLWSVEMPVTQDSKTKKLDYDIGKIAALLRAAAPDLICLEHVHSMPRQGVSSTFLFGKGFGILLGIVGTLELPLKLVTPRVWKASLQISADKDTSRNKATELFEACSAFWKLKKHDGLAESALLAYYAGSNHALDLVEPKDIWELYHLEVNKRDRATKNSRRHPAKLRSTKNRRPRDSKD